MFTDTVRRQLTSPPDVKAATENEKWLVNTHTHTHTHTTAKATTTHTHTHTTKTTHTSTHTHTHKTKKQKTITLVLSSRWRPRGKNKDRCITSVTAFLSASQSQLGKQQLRRRSSAGFHVQQLEKWLADEERRTPSTSVYTYPLFITRLRWLQQGTHVVIVSPSSRWLQSVCHPHV